MRRTPKPGGLLGDILGPAWRLMMANGVLSGSWGLSHGGGSDLCYDL